MKNTSIITLCLTNLREESLNYAHKRDYMLIYTDEMIENPDGIPCLVLDVSQIDFQGAVQGRKSALTRVERAKGGEEIITRNANKVAESTYIANPDDAIFINIEMPEDMYVPGNSDGSRWKYDEVSERGYEAIDNGSLDDWMLVKSTKTAYLMPQVIQTPSCIKDAWGQEQHQFLFQGATLKLDDSGKVTGIDHDAFEATWEIIPLEPSVLPPANTPKLRL